MSKRPLATASLHLRVRDGADQPSVENLFESVRLVRTQMELRAALTVWARHLAQELGLPGEPATEPCAHGCCPHALPGHRPWIGVQGRQPLPRGADGRPEYEDYTY